MSRLVAIGLLAALGAGCGTPASPDAASSAWRVGPMLPRPALAAGVTALGTSVVVAGGFLTAPASGGEVTAEVDAFDTASDGWRMLPDAPVRWTDLNLGGVGATLYLAGGLDAQGVAHGEAFALDPVDQRWQPIPSLPPGEERGGAGVVSARDRVYLLGGVSSTGPLATCLAYNIAARTWEPLPALPAPRAHPAAMRRSDGTLIVAGGFASADASEPRSDVWGLTPLATAWQPLSAMHLPGEADARGDCAYGVVLGELTCAGGGGPAPLHVVESYQPFTDVWTLREPMPAARSGTQGAAVGAQLYVPGGADASGAPTQTLYIYAPLATGPR